jgi:inorganic pyrophosphatase
MATPLVAIVVSGIAAAGQSGGPAPDVLPAAATTRLAESLDAARPHRQHVWRDAPPTNADGTVNGYIEISRGDRRKWEFNMAANARQIDRVIAADVGGFPVNYGFVPQTVSYDGDPFDVLVLGPPLPAGEVVRGVIAGFMHMEDEKGLDSKVVLSPVGASGRPMYELTPADREEIAAFFRAYKKGEPGRFSKVPGWGSIDEGRAYVSATQAFFKACGSRAGAACRIPQ